MTPLRDICAAFAPEYLARYPHLPIAHRKPSALSHSAKAGLMATACLSANVVASNTVSILPVAPGTVHSASSIQASSGFIPIWRDSGPGRTASSP